MDGHQSVMYEIRLPQYGERPGDTILSCEWRVASERRIRWSLHHLRAVYIPQPVDIDNTNSMQLDFMMDWIWTHNHEQTQISDVWNTCSPTWWVTRRGNKFKLGHAQQKLSKLVCVQFNSSYGRGVSHNHLITFIAMRLGRCNELRPGQAYRADALGTSWRNTLVTWRWSLPHAPYIEYNS